MSPVGMVLLISGLALIGIIVIGIAALLAAANRHQYGGGTNLLEQTNEPAPPPPTKDTRDDKPSPVDLDDIITVEDEPEEQWDDEAVILGVPDGSLSGWGDEDDATEDTGAIAPVDSPAVPKSEVATGSIQDRDIRQPEPIVPGPTSGDKPDSSLLPEVPTDDKPLGGKRADVTDGLTDERRREHIAKEEAAQEEYDEAEMIDRLGGDSAEESPDWLSETTGEEASIIDSKQSESATKSVEPAKPSPPGGSLAEKESEVSNAKRDEASLDDSLDALSKRVMLLHIQKHLAPETASAIDAELSQLQTEIHRLRQQRGSQALSLEPQLTQARFTAYYPRESAAGTQYGLYVYAHVQEALQTISADVQTFAALLGGAVPKPKIAPESAALAAGTRLTVMPEVEGLEFEPLAVTKKWQTPFTRFDFNYTAPDSAVGEIINGRVAILIGSVEIASIPFATMVEQPSRSPQFEATLHNPLAAAKHTTSHTAHIYNKIFISYSRSDQAVAETYRLAQLAVGHDVFMDSYSIRTGENWQAALAQAIDAADIFQLFWSEHSAASENVRHEWDYALNYKCADDGCAGFIRPVYWDKPMPTPPPELGHLNFRYVPFAGE
ncbi:MAG: TIR domain-containing protein [Chloroflexi bacterium]|nr:TIR domain-containing protein [Chloroflexota bacterium]